MPTWLLALLSPKVLFIYGPLSAIGTLETIALVYLWKRHEELHAQRLADVTKMKDEYMALVQSVEKTLDVMIKVLSSRGNK